MSMNWRYATEDAGAIADSAFQFASGLGGVGRARAARHALAPAATQAWRDMAGMGWLGMLVPEAQEGLGLGMTDVAAVLESLGRVLAPEPLLQGIVAARLLADIDPSDGSEWRAELLAGARVVVPAMEAPRVDAATGDMSLWLPDATRGVTVLVAGPGGIKALDADLNGIVWHTHPCVDGSTLAEISIPRAAWETATVLGEGAAASSAWAQARHRLALGDAALLAGLMGEALHVTLAYMSLRTQFGQPIGAFQALQHRAASAYVAVAASRAVVQEACRAATVPERFGRAAGVAKAYVSEAALRVTKECVQFHGAIGFTDEHDIGLYLKRAMALAARHGTAREHRARLAA